MNPKSQIQANPNAMGLHNTPVNPGNLDLPTNVKQQNAELNSYVNLTNSALPPTKPEDFGKNVNELDSLIQQLKQKNVKRTIRRDVFEPIIQVTESLLDDKHSKGMLFKVLNVLYPERLDLYVAAVRVALDAARTDSDVNRGAVFVRALRDFADVAGIDLGLKSGSNDQFVASTRSGNLGSHEPAIASPLSPPSVDEAIWSETQLMLRRQMTQATYDAIIQRTVLITQKNGCYVIGVHNEMAKEWLENRLHDIVQRTLSSVVGMSSQVEFRLLNELE
jgi:hypothetical protein